MTHTFNIEYTDTFGGEANYAWVKRAIVTMPELTHYGYDGSANYAQANRKFERELFKRAKAVMGLTGIRGTNHAHGDNYEWRPRGMATVMFINYHDA